MGKQQPDKVTAMLSNELWDDDETITTAAPTAGMTDLTEMMDNSELETGNEEEQEIEQEEEYMEPPNKIMYNGDGEPQETSGR